MGIFSLAIRTVSTTSTQSLLTIAAGVNNAFRLLELGVTLNAATQACFGYGVSAAAGTTSSGAGTVQPEDAANTTVGNTLGIPTWTTFPTAPTSYLRRANLPATIGAGIVWTFPRGRQMLKNTGQSGGGAGDNIYNIINAPLADVWFVVDE